VDADRHQHARPPEAGAAVLADVAVAVGGERTPLEAMDNLALDMEGDEPAGAGGQNQCAPKMTKPQNASF